MLDIKINSYGKTLIGIDVGSTTIKAVVIKDDGVVFCDYFRHMSQVREKLVHLLNEISEYADDEVYMAISGSAGLGVAQECGIPFVQEVFATAETVRLLAPDTSVVIELGGEDAKIIFFEGGTDERMNGTCAGGTGAFIDQMATLMNVSPDELDKLSLNYERIYPIASRCGVFAKSDIQPLLNQGAKKENIAASIYQAVVNQTIAGLAQGRRIDGKVLFLGGPLYYLKGLRQRFKETLSLNDDNAVFPEYGRFSVSIGTALYALKQAEPVNLSDIKAKLMSERTAVNHIPVSSPLFENEEEYGKFIDRHAAASVKKADIEKYCGKAYLGIDCGSTTTKLVLLSENKELLYSYYNSNMGNPVDVVKYQLEMIYRITGNRITIAGSAVTGYGEELIKHAFNADAGLVETMAHFIAAKHFMPEVDFILDIGGQDIKCFKIRNGTIDGIMLNEACSSGCGSFIETFARALGYGIEEFSRLGLYAKHPVDLGTRCAVFMNSSVKQAQKDGAEIADTSAGLSMSIVKNALYKVIRANSADDFGDNVVVQGGTFLNDAVLRCFERELGRNVVRPNIAGLMGAFGSALYAMSLNKESSGLISPDDLKQFTHTAKAVTCNGCGNHCHMTVNTFGNGKKFVSGNQCERGLGIAPATDEVPNLYKFKRDYILSLPETDGKRGTISLPLALNMYELAPLWHTLFTTLGFNVKLSGMSTRDLYVKGQHTIPSDTACFPAKLMHGHIEKLIEDGAENIFYPALSYNIDEGTSKNHYNCPVVAYYGELLYSNVDFNGVRFLFPYLNINKPKELVKELITFFQEFFPKQRIDKREIKKAVKNGFKAYDDYMNKVRAEGKRAVEYAKVTGKRIAVIAGRPYHIDSEINHGIDKLLTSLDFVVVSEDSVNDSVKPVEVNVLNQWTYHSRMYNAAEFAIETPKAELIPLVSFGCGIDAITTDEIREMLEKNDKIYTQIKIDEITNLGAVKIRLRSLIEALNERDN